MSAKKVCIGSLVNGFCADLGIVRVAELSASRNNATSGEVLESLSYDVSERQGCFG
jgi:hypothetical protein